LQAPQKFEARGRLTQRRHAGGGGSGRGRGAAEDRAAITALTDDLDRVEIAYRETPDYPGELQAYQGFQRLRTPFFAA